MKSKNIGTTNSWHRASARVSLAAASQSFSEDLKSKIVRTTNPWHRAFGCDSLTAASQRFCADFKSKTKVTTNPFGSELLLATASQQLLKAMVQNLNRRLHEQQTLSFYFETAVVSLQATSSSNHGSQKLRNKYFSQHLETARNTR